MGRKLTLPVNDPQVVAASSASEAALLIGARSATAHLVKGLSAIVWVDDQQQPDMPLNHWATELLGQDVRGSVVALVVRPAV